MAQSKRESEIETVTIPLTEYKDLLIAKGAYDEVRRQRETITIAPLDYRDYGIKEDEFPPLNPYKLTCQEGIKNGTI